MSIDLLWARLESQDWRPLAAHSDAYQAVIRTSSIGQKWQAVCRRDWPDLPCPELDSRYQEQIEVLVAHMGSLKGDARHQVEASIERILWQLFGLSTDEIWWVARSKN